MDGPKTLMEFMDMYQTEEDCRAGGPAQVAAGHLPSGRHQEDPLQCELSRQLGVAPQTAWTRRRKIMHALAQREDELLLLGLVEMDEAYVGGKEPGDTSPNLRARALRPGHRASILQKGSADCRAP